MDSAPDSVQAANLGDLVRLLRAIAAEVRGRAVPRYVMESVGHAASELHYYVHHQQRHRPRVTTEPAPRKGAYRDADRPPAQPE